MVMSVMLVLLVLLVFTQATLILAVEAAAVDISMLPLGVNTGGQQLLAEGGDGSDVAGPGVGHLLLQTKQAILHHVLGLGRLQGLQGLQGGRIVCYLHQVLAGPQFRPRDRDRLGHSSPLHLEDRKGPGGYSYKSRDCSFEFKIV